MILNYNGNYSAAFAGICFAYFALKKVRHDFVKLRSQIVGKKLFRPSRIEIRSIIVGIISYSSTPYIPSSWSQLSDHRLPPNYW